MEISVGLKKFSCVALLAMVSGQVSADLIKMSSSGLCHTPASPYYERTQTFTPYGSLDECVAKGGRAREPNSAASSRGTDEYSRDRFGHGWADVDGDCQNSRMEALISQSTGQVRFAEDGCRVVAGRWISPFTGQVIHDASEIDIDHVVPLKWAWEHGADTWSQEKRERFANDPVNLWSVELSLNRQKGAKGPEEWLPPSGQCQYVSRYVRILRIYGLRLSEEMRRFYRRKLDMVCG